MNFRCAQGPSCYGHFTDISFDDEIVACLIALFATAFGRQSYELILIMIGYFTLFLYLDAVLPREYGIPEKPLFFLDPIFSNKKNRHHNDPPADRLLSQDGEEDADVAKLRKLIESGKYSDNDPLVTVHLRKVYDDGHVALHDLNLLAKVNISVDCLLAI